VEAVVVSEAERGRRLTVVAIVVISVVAVVGVFVKRGSGGSGHPHKTVRVDLAAVAKASLEPTHVHIVDDDGDGAATVADGVIDPRTLTLDLSSVDTVHGHKLLDRILVVDGASYLDPQTWVAETTDTSQGPTAAQLAAFLHGRHWIRVDAPKRRSSTTDLSHGGQTLTDVMSLNTIGGNVSALLAQLAKAGVKVVDLGAGTVNGAPAEHWRVRYSNHDLFTHDTDPPADEPVTTIDLWVDATYHELRAETSTAAVHTATDESPASHSTTTFTDYGAPIHVHAPKTSDTVSYIAFQEWVEQFQHGGISLPAPSP
jgi:hypothetical protein